MVIFVNKFTKALIRSDFSDQIRELIQPNKRNGYNMNVMCQTACLVFDRILVDNYAARWDVVSLTQ